MTFASPHYHVALISIPYKAGRHRAETHGTARPARDWTQRAINNAIIIVLFHPRNPSNALIRVASARSWIPHHISQAMVMMTCCCRTGARMLNPAQRRHHHRFNHFYFAWQNIYKLTLITMVACGTLRNMTVLRNDPIHSIRTEKQ